MRLAPEKNFPAIATLRNGGVIAYPTEAVWGLGCDPLDEQAVMRVLALKKRDWRKGVILVAASIEQLAPYLRGLDDEKYATLRKSWPGPNTWLVPDNGVAPSWITGGQPTLAVRVSAHPVVAALCHAFDGAIVSTSANIAGDPPARSIRDVIRYFGNDIDVIVPGDVGGADKPTQIRNLMTGEICRPA
ncbi:MAG TPA: Sua5/YciO/YrdC/YwlC family protein [Pseudomonadales bacterium]|nr:Sua5/YciO/YrdC/YwlC family protein [Pseudomonadales bacterium]